MYLKSQRPKSAACDSVYKVLGNVRTGQPLPTMSVRSLVPASLKIFQQNGLSEFQQLSLGLCQHWPVSVHSYLSQRHETNGGLTPGRMKEFFYQNFHISIVIHPAPYFVSAWSYFSGDKAAGAWSRQPLSSSAEVKLHETVFSLLHTLPWLGCSVSTWIVLLLLYFKCVIDTLPRTGGLSGQSQREDHKHSSVYRMWFTGQKVPNKLTFFEVYRHQRYVANFLAIFSFKNPSRQCEKNCCVRMTVLEGFLSTLRDFKFPPRRRSELRSFGPLLSE